MLGYECAGFWPAISEGERYLGIGVVWMRMKGRKGEVGKEMGKRKSLGDDFAKGWGTRCF